ncbi:DUF6059 family protein [Streptomyces sp. NBC_00280]|uniref:DUF6059 family protein n=1 Tax=Streptomyces sp. NBC_00280 TaxID=2975699 RepID=UPI00352F43F0
MVWLGLISLGSFWTGPLPQGADERDSAALVPPSYGHPERLAPRTPLTSQERTLARELGWTR